MLDGAFHNLPVSPEWLQRTSRIESLTPAQIQRAARIASHLDDYPGDRLEPVLSRVLDEGLRLSGPVATGGQVPALDYRLDALNADHALPDLAEGLAKLRSGRIALYGPPGTGKSAFAHYLGQTLDMPVLQRRASDLLGRYVGDTEAAIARMFQTARQQGALLLVDEADSFLQDRAQAREHWQLTQVNELLVQMEAYEGLLVMSTNLMERLDPAVLRRFDLKIRFDYLTPAQAGKLWEALLKSLQLPLRDGMPERRELARLERLTPGDFATVQRKLRLLPQAVSPQRVLEALAAECQAKPGAKQRIGFM